MTLENEIQHARKEIVTDGYDMSVGEIINLYRDNEITINPAYQRLYRWDHTRKTRFIESLLLGIPLPPIFVYQNDDGKWELIDGLQRMSTLLEFSGHLPANKQDKKSKLALEGTKLLPSLDGATWDTLGKNDIAATRSLQLLIKRARIRVEILKRESDPVAKFELFQRLNTGGLELSEQEVRDCVAIMINAKYHQWIQTLSSTSAFRDIISLSEDATNKGYHRELVIRFVSFRSVPYIRNMDVHEYLDEASISIAKNPNFNYAFETEAFDKTFALLRDSLGSNAFRKYDGEKFAGKFVLSAYEVVAYGLSLAIDKNILPSTATHDFVVDKVKRLWSNNKFKNFSKSGISGTRRLTNLIPFAAKYFLR